MAGPQVQTRGMLSMHSNTTTKSGFTEVGSIEQKSLVMLREKQNVPWPKKLWKIQSLGLEIHTHPSLAKAPRRPQFAKITCLKTSAMHPLPETPGRGCYDRVPKHHVSWGQEAGQHQVGGHSSLQACGASSLPTARGCPTGWLERIKPLGQESVAQTTQIPNNQGRSCQ